LVFATLYYGFEEKKKRQIRSRLDNGLNFGFLRMKHVITFRFRAGIQVVPGRQQNGQHLVWIHMHYEGRVVVAGKPHVCTTQKSKNFVCTNFRRLAYASLSFPLFVPFGKMHWM